MPEKRFSPLRDLRICVLFLTRIPVGAIANVGPGDLSRAAWAFPIIGGAVGALAGSVLYFAAATHLHPLACAVLALAVSALITGALHEDGLADVADGFGAYTRDRALAIMRDSQIGTFGVLALIFSFGLKVTALAGIPGPGMAWTALIGAAAFSRGLLPAIMYALPHAREDGRSHHAGRPSGVIVIVAAVIGSIALVFTLPGMLPLLAGGIAMVAGVTVCLWAHCKLGGQTGDVLGAAQQLIETAILLAAAAWSLDFMYG